MAQNNNATASNAKNSGKIIKLLQIVSAVFIVLSVVAGVWLINKYDLSVSNIYTLKDLITGGTVTIIAGVVVFTVIKSFALIFPPAFVFAFTGLLLDNLALALTVNFVAASLSLFLPYALGKFTGKSTLDTLKKKFPKIQKLDSFAQMNDFAFVFLIKASGIIASDLSSLIFGAMGIKSKTHLVASVLGLLPVNIVWTLLGSYADLTDPKSVLFLLPVVALAVGGTFWAKKLAKKSTPPIEAEAIG